MDRETSVPATAEKKKSRLCQFPAEVAEARPPSLLNLTQADLIGQTPMTTRTPTAGESRKGVLKMTFQNAAVQKIALRGG